MATQLAHAIKFAHLADDLSKDEFISFLNKILDDGKRYLITTSFFQHFVTHFNTNDLNDINSMLSDIIQSRETKPKSPPTRNIKLNEMPSSLIGYTASFLEQYDYFSFQRTTRSIFIGCNSPNMLRTLDVIDINDYSDIKMFQFRSLTRVFLHIETLNEFISLYHGGQIPYIFPGLQELALSGNFKNNINMQPFMAHAQELLNFESIKSLTFLDFGNLEDVKFDAETFYEILTQFSNIEYLSFQYVVLDADISDEQWKKLDFYGKLKGFHLDGGDDTMYNQCMQLFGNNLNFLELNFNCLNLDSINFDKLRQVILTYSEVEFINSILKTGKNIEYFSLFPEALSPTELKNVIPRIFDCKSLQYFGITASEGQSSSILNGIEIGLFRTNKWKRNELKIRYAVDNAKIDLSEMIFSLGRIIFRLLASVNTADFMFILELQHMHQTSEEELNENQILAALNDISPDIEIKRDGLCFVLTNKNCKICGTIRKWLYGTDRTVLSVAVPENWFSS